MAVRPLIKFFDQRVPSKDEESGRDFVLPFAVESVALLIKVLLPSSPQSVSGLLLELPLEIRMSLLRTTRPEHVNERFACSRQFSVV
jgi:hypothetical protein